MSTWSLGRITALAGQGGSNSMLLQAVVLHGSKWHTPHGAGAQAAGVVIQFAENGVKGFANR